MSKGESGGFKGTKGSSITISDKKMYQDGNHFNKHGRNMGYSDKKSYDAAAKEFVKKYQDDPNASIYEGIWNGKGTLNGHRQRIVTYGGKTAIIDPNTGQVIDFYQGTDYRGIINIKKLR
ncbi:hypothetical protein FACS1894188_01400 [Clostridia bacterium]|nr:hypothetical protein FACS1894188_01400 [Clostridia bacterium]